MSIYIGDKEIKDLYAGGSTSISDMQGPCQEGFHVPLSSEWQAVKAYMDVYLDGAVGNKGTNFSRYLSLPFAGKKYRTNGNIGDKTTLANYWSSTHSGSTVYVFYMTSTSIYPNDGEYSSAGLSIRPFKDSPVEPGGEGWVKIITGSIAEEALWYNESLGLFSLTRRHYPTITVADKNVGATTVWNYGNTLSEENCGKYYQWGNNYGFSRNGGGTTSSTQVDASAYGPGNYYENSTFITRSSDGWDSSINRNLWGGVSQGITEEPKKAKAVYLGDVKVRPSKYEYSYDFRNKTISEFGADGWTYDSSKVPSFNSDGIYYTTMTSTTSTGIVLNYDLTSAKKITLNTSFVITNRTTHLAAWGIAPYSGASGYSGIMLTNMLGAHTQDIRIGDAKVSSTNVNVPSTGTYAETIEYDLVNKTYTYSGCYPTSGSLTDAQISLIRNNDGLTVAVGGSSGIKISTIDITIEY